MPKQSKQSKNCPPKDKDFVAWGHYSSITKVIKSQLFYPVYIVGLSGCGKTMMVEQVCSDLKRDMYRVNITVDTDEDDLIGGFRLVKGETVWNDGPVIRAAKEGSIVLLDEIDLGTIKLMCLQSLLEGRGIFIKKISEWVTPKKGFNIIATANTKGTGDETSKFVGTNIHNESMLERFPATLIQPYPPMDTEMEILTNRFNQNGIECDESIKLYIRNLLTWASNSRSNYENGGSDDFITTRRLCQIADTYSIFPDRIQAIKNCLNRFDDDTAATLLVLYKKLSGSF